MTQRKANVHSDLTFMIGGQKLIPAEDTAAKLYTYTKYSLEKYQGEFQPFAGSGRFDVKFFPREQEPPGTRERRRVVMPPRYFETQYKRQYSVVSDGEDDVITRADSVTIINMSSARYVLPELDQFLYFCPKELTWFLRNFAFKSESSMNQTNSAAFNDFVTIAKNLRLSENSFIDIQDINLFRVTYRKKHVTTNFREAEEVVIDNGLFEHINSKFNFPSVDFAPSQQQRILSRMTKELDALRGLFPSSSEFQRRCDKMIEFIRKKEIPEYDETESFSTRHLEQVSVEDASRLFSTLAQREARNARFGSPILGSSTQIYLPEQVEIGDILTSGHMDRFQKQGDISAMQKISRNGSR